MRLINSIPINKLSELNGYMRNILMTFSSLDDYIKLLIFFSNFTKMTTFENSRG